MVHTVIMFMSVIINNNIYLYMIMLYIYYINFSRVYL